MIGIPGRPGGMLSYVELVVKDNTACHASDLSSKLRIFLAFLSDLWVKETILFPCQTKNSHLYHINDALLESMNLSPIL